MRYTYPQSPASTAAKVSGQNSIGKFSARNSIGKVTHARPENRAHAPRRCQEGFAPAHLTYACGAMIPMDTRDVKSGEGDQPLDLWACMVRSDLRASVYAAV